MFQRLFCNVLVHQKKRKLPNNSGYTDQDIKKSRTEDNCDEPKKQEPDSRLDHEISSPSCTICMFKSVNHQSFIVEVVESRIEEETVSKTEETICRNGQNRLSCLKVYRACKNIEN